MRSDYALYAVAMIFFIITVAVAAYSIQQQLWIVTTAIIGLVFVGLGYTQRPKPTTPTALVPAQMIPPPPPIYQVPAEAAKEEKTGPDVKVVSTIETPSAVEPITTASELTRVKGVGPKRTEQLNALGINSIEDLAKASATDLAAKLKISPKISTKWIENAKALAKKS